MASCRRRPVTLRCVILDPRCKGRTNLTVATAQRCPIHCEGSFGDWTTCDPDPCSAGTRSRIYTVTTEKDFGGDDCSDDGTTLDGPLTEGRVEEVDCVYLSECPIDCACRIGRGIAGVQSGGSFTIACTFKTDRIGNFGILLPLWRTW